MKSAHLCIWLNVRVLIVRKNVGPKIELLSEDFSLSLSLSLSLTSSLSLFFSLPHTNLHMRNIHGEHVHKFDFSIWCAH